MISHSLSILRLDVSYDKLAGWEQLSREVTKIFAGRCWALLLLYCGTIVWITIRDHATWKIADARANGRNDSLRGRSSMCMHQHQCASFAIPIIFSFMWLALMRSILRGKDVRHIVCTLYATTNRKCRLGVLF